jgi:hypothetical protein
MYKSIIFHLAILASSITASLIPNNTADIQLVGPLPYNELQEAVKEMTVNGTLTKRAAGITEGVTLCNGRNLKGKCCKYSTTRIFKIMMFLFET